MNESKDGTQNVLVLSPHRDDAAFSCGLLLATLVGAGVRVSILNVCTVSDYAPYLPSPQSIESVTRVRAAEDDAFAADLRANSGDFALRAPAQIKFIDLAWKDAPLRLSIPTEKVLTEPAPHAEDVARLAELFSQFPAAQLVFAPMALGGHLDHRTVHDAAARTWNANQMVFYEDLPYACGMEATELRKQTARCLPAGCEALVFRGRQPRETKRRYANHYPSQIAAELAEAMEAHAATLGMGERVYGHRAALQTLHALAAFASPVDTAEEVAS